jgi:hypothetical protein
MVCHPRSYAIGGTKSDAFWEEARLAQSPDAQDELREGESERAVESGVFYEWFEVPGNQIAKGPTIDRRCLRRRMAGSRG